MTAFAYVELVLALIGLSLVVAGFVCFVWMLCAFALGRRADEQAHKQALERQRVLFTRKPPR